MLRLFSSQQFVRIKFVFTYTFFFSQKIKKNLFKPCRKTSKMIKRKSKLAILLNDSVSDVFGKKYRAVYRLGQKSSIVLHGECVGMSKDFRASLYNGLNFLAICEKEKEKENFTYRSFAFV